MEQVTQAASQLGKPHSNETVPHKISNHDMLVQASIWAGKDVGWLNLNDTQDQLNMKMDLHKVEKVVQGQVELISGVRSTANAAVSQAESAVSASKVNSEAIAAQSEAVSEAKSAISSATAEIQQIAATAASDAAKIRADVAQVQSEVDTAKAANSATVEALKSDVSAAKQDIQAARQANENVAKQLDDYTKQAQAQGKTIKDIQNAQDGYTATLADVKGNVSKISDAVDGLSASLKDDQDNVATIKAKADDLSATLTDHDKNIAQLTASAKELSSTLEDADGRISKVEQTASTLTNEFSDQDGRLSKVEQTATGTQQTVANQQGQINSIQTDAAGIHETLTGQGDQIANINVTLNGLNTKYEGVSGDLGKLSDKITTNSTQIMQNKQAIALKADQSTVNNLSGEVSQNSAQLKVQADQISSKVSSTDFTALNGRTMQNRGTVNSPDFNSLTQAGFYTITNPPGGKNYPTGSWGTLEVSGQVTDANGRLNQKYVSDNGGITYTRQYNAGAKSWTSWAKVANQNDIDTLNGEITKNSTDIDQTNQKISLKADQTEVDQVKQTATQNSSRLNVMADEISSKVTATDVNNIVGGKGYATTITVQSLVDQKASQISQTIANVQSTVDKNGKAISSTNDKLTNVTQTVDGLQTTVKNKADQSVVNQLSNQLLAKVSTNDYQAEIALLTKDLNLRVSKGDLISQINLEAGGNGLISVKNGKGKLLLDADSVIFGHQAFIPSAAITNIEADKIKSGTLDAGAMRVVNLTADSIHGGTLDVGDMNIKNFSANDIETGTLSGVTIRAGDTTDFFQTSQDNIYWITSSGEQSALLGKGRYVTFPGLNIFDSHAIYLGTWAGADLENGTIKDTGGSLGHPKFNIEDPSANSALDLSSKFGEMGSPLDNSRISGWVGQKEFFSLEQTRGFFVSLKPDFNTSTFAIQKDNHVGASFGNGDNGNQIIFNFSGDGCGFNVNGPLHVTGSKNSIVETRQGYLAINAYETAEYYFGDIGENNTGDTSQVVIGIDRIFNEVVNTDIQYQVFVTPYSNAHVWVEKRYNNRFIVKSDRPNAEFGWELKAKRKGYESNRLRRVNVDFNQMDLKGEN